MKWYKIKGRTIWQIDWEKVETVTDFIFLGSKITADGDYNHEIKRHLLPGRKALTNLDSILKSRDTTAEKGAYSQSYSFSIVMYGCESWTVRLSTEEMILLSCGAGENS